MTAPARRRTLIAQILRGGPAESQESLRQRLAGRGVEVTQATLSRDLRDLGVVKGPAGYVLLDQAAGVPATPGRNGGGLDRALSAFVVSVVPAGSLVVLKTGPGQAQAIAVELDRDPPAGALGTIAGDDTIFIATESAAASRRLADALLGRAGLARERGGVGR